MRKALCAIIAGIMLQSAGAGVYAQNIEAEAVQEVYAPTEKAQEAQALLIGLGETDFFNELDDLALSRGDFIYGLMDVLGIDVGASYEGVFVDVPTGSKYSKPIGNALSFGFISKSDNFRVNDAIKLNEAIKIAVGVLGYTSMAEIQGGYPQGYISIASERDLFKNIDIKEEITKEDMAILLYNMLMSEVADIEYLGTKATAYRAGEDTLLEVIHGVYSTEGIITKNSVTSYDLSHSYIKGNSTVEVDGEEYNSKTDIDKYFGMNCVAWYDDEGIVAVYPKRNSEITIFTEDVTDIKNSKLIYEDEIKQKEKSIKLDANYLEVYNGMTTKADVNHIFNSSGTVRLVDNNNDNAYDVIFIEDYTYVKVKNIDATDKIIEDAHSSENNISLNEDNIKLSIHKIDGTIIKPADIKSGSVLQVKKSFNKSLIDIVLLSAAGVGKVASVTDEDEIIINNEAYKLSDYAKSYSVYRL